jgi:hypothetical protein
MTGAGAVICDRCGSQCAQDVAVARGWRPGQCPRCPPSPTSGNSHPIGVQFAWWPDWPEVMANARRVWTAACGCRWAASSSDERSAWAAAFDHQGVLAAWRARPVTPRPPFDAGPRHRVRMRYELDAARLPGVPLRTMMACDDATQDRHACRGVIPPGPGAAELCACPCHDRTGEPDPCRHCGAPIGHLARCPTRPTRIAPVAAADQLALFG